MKWKRSRKAQQEAKSKDGNSEKVKSQSANSKITDEHHQHSHNISHHILDDSNNNNFVNGKTKNIVDHPNSKHVHLIAQNMTNFQNGLDCNINGNSNLINSNSLLFSDGAQNNDMFRPYVV